jgi:hypothetical protein
MPLLRTIRLIFVFMFGLACLFIGSVALLVGCQNIQPLSPPDTATSVSPDQSNNEQGRSAESDEPATGAFAITVRPFESGKTGFRGFIKESFRFALSRSECLLTCSYLLVALLAVNGFWHAGVQPVYPRPPGGLSEKQMNQIRNRQWPSEQQVLKWLSKLTGKSQTIGIRTRQNRYG